MRSALSRRAAAAAAVIGAAAIGGATIATANAGVPNVGEQPQCLVFNAGQQKHYFYMEYIQGDFRRNAQVFGQWNTKPISGAWVATADHWEVGARLISLSSNVAGNNCDISITLTLNPNNYTVDGKIYVRCTSLAGVVRSYQGYLTEAACYY